MNTKGRIWCTVRGQPGSVLVLCLAIFGGLIMLLLSFGFVYMRFIAAQQEQATAIESASLAAARELSRIVIEDPHFGFISLSDCAPTGKNTRARDCYFLPVRSINTIFATVRTDMSIVHGLRSKTMTEAATNDYDAAVAAAQRLKSVLLSATSPDFVGFDADGQPVCPYAVAKAAYELCKIRATGNRTQLIAKSFKLSVGYIPDLPTCSVAAWGPIDSSNAAYKEQLGACYLAYHNYALDDKTFVFAAIDSSVTLVNAAQFQTDAGDLSAYSVPAVVKVEGDEQYDQIGGQSRRVHAVACAESCSTNDPHPAPGILVITFANGTISEIGSLSDIITGETTAGQSASLYTSEKGDYPVPSKQLAPLHTDQPGCQPNTASACSRAVYDWLRCGGPLIEPIGAVQALNSLRFAQSNASTAYVLRFTDVPNDLYPRSPPGSVGLIRKIQVTSSSINANPMNMLSEQQLLAVDDSAFISSSGKRYDVFVQDEVAHQGRIAGGLHAGEPRVDPRFSSIAISKIWQGHTSSPLTLCSQIVQNNPEPPNPPTRNGPTVGWSGPAGGTLYAIWKRLYRAQGTVGGGGSMQPADFYAYTTGFASGTIRPTYDQTGLCAEIRFEESLPLRPQ